MVGKGDWHVQFVKYIEKEVTKAMIIPPTEKEILNYYAGAQRGTGRERNVMNLGSIEKVLPYIPFFCRVCSKWYGYTFVEPDLNEDRICYGCKNGKEKKG